MIHPLADVQSKSIGEATNIWQFSIVLPGAIIGDNCNINCHVFIENDVVIGDNVTIKSGVYIWDGLRIGHNVFIGPSVVFINNPYPRSKKYPDRHIGAKVMDGVSIGANSTIMGDIEIGKHAMIGAASFVNKNVGAYELWFGSPAIHKGYVTEEGEILGLNFKSKKTGRLYCFKNYKLVTNDKIP